MQRRARKQSSRLQGLRQNAAKGIQSETPEQWADRLNVVRQNTTERVASETSEQRADRLNVVTQNTTERVASETPEQRADRLNVVRQNTTERAASETAEEREITLPTLRTMPQQEYSRRVCQNERKGQRLPEKVQEREGQITCLFKKSMFTIVNSICTKVDGKIQRIPYTSKNGSETKWVVSIRAKKCQSIASVPFAKKPGQPCRI